jgi:cell division protein FtsL
MTFIQPHQEKNIYILFAVFLFAMLFTGVVWLIFLYNKNVDLNHATADAKIQIQKLQLQNSQARDTLFSYLEGSNVEKFASVRGLVQEKSPRYLRASNDTKWVFASRF